MLAAGAAFAAAAGPALAQAAAGAAGAPAVATAPLPAGQTPARVGAVDYTGDLRDFVLGTKAEDLPTVGYFEFACGSNGGPQLQRLGGFVDFMECAKDARGTHEVYFEFDNEGEFTARMLADLMGAEAGIPKQRLYGTRIFGQPVVLSMLIDDEGIARGIRAVTDARAEFELRRGAYLLRVPILRTYDTAEWVCTDLPLGPGEAPLGNTYYKQRCEAKTAPDRYMYLASDLFRRPGEQGFTRGGEGAQGEFWSETRWELWEADFVGH